MWFQPLLVYAIALVLQVVPLSEQSIRIPMALVGVANVLLTYAVAKLLTRREWPSVVAAVMLALTPAHFLFARAATDYLLPVPFILGWLWCVLRYQETGQPRTLLVGSLALGVGLYSLIASYILMPLFALLTCLALLSRRAPLHRYLIVASGLLVPALLGVAFVIAHPEMMSTVMGRYEPGQAEAGQFLATRLRNLSVFWSFWNMELLAINGQQMLTGFGGVFLLATVGAAIAGILRAVVERNVATLLLLGGLLVAPLPASLIDEAGAIRRALAMLPFVVVLAAYGIDWVGSAAMTTRRVAFVSVFAFISYLCLVYRPQLQLAQAHIRAATLPLGLVAAAALFQLARLGRRTYPWWSAAAAGLVAYAFVYFYIDLLFVQRVGVVPATLIVWLYRVVCAAAIAILGVMLARSRMLPGHLRTVLLAVGMTLLTIAYFYVDRFTAIGPRIAHVGLVATVTIMLASTLRGAAFAPHRLMQIAAATLLAITSLQFVLFYQDYWDGYRLRRDSEREGNVLRAFDAVLDRPDVTSVPMFYLATPMERADVRDIFWQFAALKHATPLVLGHTISESAREIDEARASALPAGSVVVAGASPVAVQRIDRLVLQGVLVRNRQVVAADGVPIAWILRRPAA